MNENIIYSYIIWRKIQLYEKLNVATIISFQLDDRGYAQ